MEKVILDFWKRLKSFNFTILLSGKSFGKKELAHGSDSRCVGSETVGGIRSHAYGKNSKKNKYWRSHKL